MWGGSRKGSGRRKGSVNRVSAAQREAIAASGEETPLDYMLRVMRDQTADMSRRDDMAKAAGPYVHPRLAAIEHSGSIEQPVTEITDAQLDTGIAQISSLIAGEEAAPNDPSKLN